jgi:hypothetical protein
VEEDRRFESAMICECCEKQFRLDNPKVRHHCHITGKFLSVVCRNCNLALKYPVKPEYGHVIPVVFHNLRGYDAHIILKNATKEFVPAEMKVIANNKEKYISFDIRNFRFIDSLQFLNESLVSLVDNLKKGGLEKFVHTRQQYDDEVNFQLVSRKGVYPYEYMSSVERFCETTLPPISAFHSTLADSDISAEDYSHAQKVWETFGIANMQDYHDLYLKTDVLLLADVFEEFRRTSLVHYKLDPAHFFTAPGLSFYACLKMTDVKLELFNYIDQLLFVEKGIRGGTSYIANRLSTANNECVGHDPAKPSTHITYLDANNLYGWAMSQPLPTGDFYFLTEKQISKFDVTRVRDMAEYGYILEVDLKYPYYLHDEHNDYPLAVERVQMTSEMLSPTSKVMLDTLQVKYVKCEKLVPNLSNKKQYVVHYRNLKFYVDHGMKITKIHRILKFRQSAWLAPYIELNTRLRQAATTTFEKNFFKLMNNAMFGKTMENLRKRIDVRLVSDKGTAEKLVAKSSFESSCKINDDLELVKLTKSTIHWSKPTYVGFCVLDLSKLHMYKFHYDVLKPMYGDRLKLLFTDTDSLCYEVQTTDLFKDMTRIKHHLDTSDYPANHPLHSTTNAKVLGKFKDECTGVSPLQFVGLRSKMYSLLLPGGKVKATAKGIKKSFAKKKIRHDQYLHCLKGDSTTTAEFHNIRSFLHTLKTVKVVKRALSAFDDKRFILPNKCDTLAHGHWAIVDMQKRV